MGTTMQHPRLWLLPHRNIYFLLAVSQTPTPVPPPENRSKRRFTSMVKATLSTIQKRQPPPKHPLLLLPPPPPNTIIPDSSLRDSGSARPGRWCCSWCPPRYPSAGTPRRAPGELSDRLLVSRVDSLHMGSCRYRILCLS